MQILARDPAPTLGFVIPVPALLVLFLSLVMPGIGVELMPALAEVTDQAVGDFQVHPVAALTARSARA